MPVEWGLVTTVILNFAMEEGEGGKTGITITDKNAFHEIYLKLLEYVDDTTTISGTKKGAENTCQAIEFVQAVLGIRSNANKSITMLSNKTIQNIKTMMFPILPRSFPRCSSSSFFTAALSLFTSMFS